MYKRIFFAFAALLLSVSLWAQTGGVTGTVVNRSGRVPVTGAEVRPWSRDSPEMTESSCLKELRTESIR